MYNFICTLNTRVYTNATFYLLLLQDKTHFQINIIRACLTIYQTFKPDAVRSFFCRQVAVISVSVEKSQKHHRRRV